MSNTEDNNSNPKRTAEDTTIAELFETVAPPRPGVTGAHLVAVGPSYLLVIQGPEALALTRHILDFVEAVHEKADGSSVG